MNLLKANAIKVAQYDFTNKQGQNINTSKLIVSLGEYGTLTLCSDLANPCAIFDKLQVVLENKDNKLVIKSIEK